MNWRLVVLAVVAVALAATAAVLLFHGSQLQAEAQNIYIGQITAQQQKRASEIQAQASFLLEFVPSMGFAALLAALAVPTVLARRWQLTQRAQSPAR